MKNIQRKDPRRRTIGEWKNLVTKLPKEWKCFNKWWHRSLQRVRRQEEVIRRQTIIWWTVTVSQEHMKTTLKKRNWKKEKLFNDNQVEVQVFNKGVGIPEVTIRPTYLRNRGYNTRTQTSQPTHRVMKWPVKDISDRLL